MSALLLSALAAGSSGQGALYVDDVFSTYLYTGNGTSQTINNGIDLAGKGGLVWIKRRSGAGGSHALFDSVRGRSSGLATDSAAAQLSTSSGNDFKSFNSAGFSLDSGLNWNINVASSYYASWTFRRAQKFFDVVTYTGDGAAGRQIPHSLGAQAGFVTVKATSTTGDWNSYHRSATGDLKLNTTDAQTASRSIITAADASTFTVSGAANTNGVSYVAYLWAHDPSADGIIQCGSFTTDANGNATVNLGWEPQFLITKPSPAADGWRMWDVMRGLDQTQGAQLLANTSGAEVSITAVTRYYVNATGLSVTNLNSSLTYIYLAIRRPNKPPTSGTQVYNAIARTGTSAAATVTGVGFAPDLVTSKARNSTEFPSWFDRLRGKFLSLISSAANAETSLSTSLIDFSMDGASYGTDSTGIINSSGVTYINHFFRRAAGFMDVVCYAGTGVARTVPHNLGVAPELMIVKQRNGTWDWFVYTATNGPTKYLGLSSNGVLVTSALPWDNTTPTSNLFYVGASGTGGSNETYVAYLFASLPGISKVGSYTGNGSSQTIDCGFSTGARFVLIKRTDATGDWYVWDTARGIVAANDPHLSLNTTAAEVTTDDSIDPASVGFIVNQNTATNINVTGANYIFLAIA